MPPKRIGVKRLVGFVIKDRETGEEELVFRYIPIKKKRVSKPAPKIITEDADGKQTEVPYS